MDLLDIYTDVKQGLLAAGVKSVVIFKTEVPEKPLPTPIALVEFSNIGYNSRTNRSLEADISLTLHLWFKKFEYEDVSFFEVRKSIIIALSDKGYTVTGEKQANSPDCFSDWLISITAPFAVFDFTNKARNLATSKPVFDLQKG